MPALSVVPANKELTGIVDVSGLRPAQVRHLLTTDRVYSDGRGMTDQQRVAEAALALGLNLDQHFVARLNEVRETRMPERPPLRAHHVFNRVVVSTGDGIASNVVQAGRTHGNVIISGENSGIVSTGDARGSRRVPEVVVFNDAVLVAVRATGIPSEVHVSNVHALLSWSEFYGPLLKDAGCRKVEVRRLRARYLDLAEPAPVAAVYTPDSELQATTTPQFVALLKKLTKRASLRGAKLAERAGLSTSTMYSMIDVDRAVLPTIGEQVRALVRACGLSGDQIVRVMRLWGELRDRSSDCLVESSTGTASGDRSLELLWQLVRTARESGPYEAGVLEKAMLSILMMDTSASQDDRAWVSQALFDSMSDDVRKDFEELIASVKTKLSIFSRAVAGEDRGQGAA